MVLKRSASSTSALGQKQTLRRVQTMSALPPKADIDRHVPKVCFVPIADIVPLSRSPRRRARAAWQGL